jgi:hypothetical protein
MPSISTLHYLLEVEKSIQKSISRTIEFESVVSCIQYAKISRYFEKLENRLHIF